MTTIRRCSDSRDLEPTEEASRDRSRRFDRRWAAMWKTMRTSGREARSESKESLFDVLRLFDGTKKGGLLDLWQLLLGKVTINGRNVDDRRHRRHRVIARHQRGVQ